MGVLELAAVSFDGQDTAVSRYAAAKERMGEAPWTERVGLVERHRNGHLLVRGVFAGDYLYIDENDHVSQPGAAEGAVAGGLLGAMLGPPGLAVGLTLGTVIGSQAGRATDIEPEPEALVERLREVVPPSSSAIVAIAPRQEVDEMIQALSSDAASVVRQALSAQDEEALDAPLDGSWRPRTGHPRS